MGPLAQALLLLDDRPEACGDHEFPRVHLGGMEVHQLLYEVGNVLVQEPTVELAEGHEGRAVELGRAPPVGPAEEVRLLHLLGVDRVLEHVEGRRLDSHEDLDLVRALARVLVLVPPEGHVDLLLLYYVCAAARAYTYIDDMQFQLMHLYMI